MTQDWVPRWGPYSVKKIADKADWIKEMKPHHEKDGTNPFTEARQEKKMVIAKEKLKQIKNQLWAAKESKNNSKGESKGSIVAPKNDSEKPADKKVSHGEKEEKETINVK